jgi:AcrR family transcriptional regulator
MTTQPAARPKLRADAESNRRRIIAAAREVFRDRGVGATLDDVARHAGVGVGTVYRRFAGKEELLDLLVEDMIEVIAGHVQAGLDASDAWTGLTECVHHVCAEQAGDRGLREVMLGTGRGPERRAQIRERVGPMLDELVVRAQRAGKLRADLVSADVAMLQLMLAAITEHSGQPDLWRRYLVLLLDGLRAQPGAVTPLPAGHGAHPG